MILSPLIGFNTAFSQVLPETSDQIEPLLMSQELDTGWYFHSYFLGVELQHSLSTLYISRVEESPRNGDIWAIGGGQTNAGDYIGLLFRFRNGNWDAIDIFNLVDENGAGAQSLPFHIDNHGNVYYSDGYNLLINRFAYNEDLEYTPENSGLPEPVYDQERMVDIIQDNEGKVWLLYSAPRLMQFRNNEDWVVYDHQNSVLPERIDEVGIEIKLPARHLAVTGDDLWITTHQDSSGLIRKSGDDWFHYTTENSELPSNLVSSVVAQSDNQLWISTLPTEFNTMNGGLVHLEDDNWTVYTTDNGLPDNFVRVHSYENEQYLWASFGSINGTEDNTHSGYLAEFDGNSWKTIAEEDEFYNSLGWLTVDSHQNKWMGGDFHVIRGGVASLNQSFLTFTKTPESSYLFNSGTEVDLRWEAGSRIEQISFSYSSDNGDTWNLIENDVDAGEFSYTYTLPDYHDKELIIKVAGDPNEEIFDVSDSFKVIDSDQPYYHLRNLLSDGTYELFDPHIHGWQIDNSKETMWPKEKWENIEYSGPLARWPERGEPSDFPSFDALTRAFGEGRTIKRYSFVGNIVPTLQARAWWMALKNQGYNGVCHGFSITSLIAFTDGVSSMRDLGASINTDNLYDAEVNNDIRKLMSTIWARQWSRDHFPAQFFNTLSDGALEYLVNFADDLTIEDLLSGDFGDMLENDEIFRAPSQTLEEVKEMLNKPGPGNSYNPLLLFPEDDLMGGHSVLAYRAEPFEDDPDKWKIFIHDSNHPDDSNTFVEVDTKNEYYEYIEPNDNDRFSGSTGLFLGDRMDGYKTTSRMIYKTPYDTNEENIRDQISSLEDIGYMFTLFSPDTDVRIKDNHGNITALEGNSSSRNIPGSFPIVPLVGGEHNPIGYFLVDTEYDIELDYLNSTEGGFTVVSDDKMYNYINYGTGDLTADRLRYGNSLSVYGSNQVFDMEIMYQQDIDENMFRLRDVSVVDGDSLSFNLENRNELAIKNYGAPISFNLELRTDFGDDGYFLYENLELDETAAYKLSVPDWEDLNNQEITLFIDNNLDGEYDDSKSLTSMPVSNSDASERKQELPEGFELHQNYPNPFNPTTQIRYSLPESAQVRLEVFNTLGQRVAVLVNEARPAGRHEASFDASGLSSGLYIYRLQTESYTETRQMMLVK